MMEPIPFQIEKFLLNQNYCIEASAGTGKTYNIKKIVAELVKSEEKISLSKILLVTYTEKAAGELRDRIRAELQEQLEAKDEFKKPLLTGEKRKRIENALAEVDNAAIGTIHSFCQKTLHDFAYEAGMPFALSMASDDVIEDLVDRKIRDEWSVELNELGINASVIQKLVVNGVKNYEEGMSFVKPISTLEDWIPTNPEFEANWIKLNTYSSGYFMAHDKGKKLVTHQIQSIISFIIEKKSSNFTKLGTIYDSTDSPEVDSALRYFFSIRGKNIIKLEKPENCAQFQFVEGKLQDVYAAFQKQKLDNKQISFDDMIAKVRDAVVKGEYSALCKKLRSTYKYAIIDEFQDTNQNQWDIFKTVFLDSSSNHIIVVGDPKQSIYSFQGADLNVYLQAKNEIIANGGIYAKLNTNFRSTDEMVRACGKIFVGQFFTSSLNQNIQFEESDSSGKVKPVLLNGLEVKPIYLARNISPEFFAKYAVSKIADFTKIVVGADGKKQTALQYYDKDQKKYQNLKLSKIAVLARTRSEMENIEKEMTFAGIPFVRYKDSNLFRSREGAQWVTLLKALNAPDFAGRNRGLLNAVLVSDFFRYNPQNVESSDFEKPNNPVLKYFAAWKSLLKAYRYAELQERIYADTQIDKFLCDSSKLQQLAKVRQIGAYIFDYLYNNHVSIEEIIKHLEGLSLGAEDSDDEDGNLVARGSDFDAVQVMTIHASKGLQFPIVISVAGFKSAYQEPQSAYVSRDGDAKVLGFDTRSKEKDLAVILDEWHRLFYVDYTRAESVLILPVYKDKWEKESEQYGFLSRALNRDDLGAFVNESDYWENPKSSSRWKSQIADYLNEISSPKRESPRAPIAELNASLGSKSIFQHSYSSLAGKLRENEDSVTTENGKLLNRQASDEAESSAAVKTLAIDPNPVRILFGDSRIVLENAVSGVVDFPRGSKLGNALHQTFELMDFEKIGSMENVAVAKECAELRILIAEQFNSQAFSIEKHPDWVDQSAHFVWNTMNAKLPEICGGAFSGKSFSLKELPAESRRAEMEFQMNALGFGENVLQNFCKGFMDLLFVRGEYYSILDWKSDVLENYTVGNETVDGTMKKVDDEYAVQRVLYSYSLVQWLKSFGKFGADEEEIFRKHFGGVYYVFFRGCRAGESSGLYAQTWKNYAELSAAFENVKSLMTKAR